MSKVLAIGDVHGCLEPVQELLRRAEGEYESIVFIGDLVDRGPQNTESVLYVRQLAREKDVVVIRGNHDDKFARFAKQSLTHILENGPAPRIKAEKMPDWQVGTKEGSGQLVSSALLDPKVRDTYSAIEELTAENYFLSWGKFLFVHGGVPADWTEFPSRRSNLRQLMYTRHISGETGKALSLGQDGPTDPYWADVYDGRFGHAIFGHQIHITDATNYSHATAIDTGYVFGGTLTGIVVDTDTGEELSRHQVDSVEEYARPRIWYGAGGYKETVEN